MARNSKGSKGYTVINSPFFHRSAPALSRQSLTLFPLLSMWLEHILNCKGSGNQPDYPVTWASGHHHEMKLHVMSRWKSSGWRQGPRIPCRAEAHARELRARGGMPLGWQPCPWSHLWHDEKPVGRGRPACQPQAPHTCCGHRGISSWGQVLLLHDGRKADVQTTLNPGLRETFSGLSGVEGSSP